MACALGDGDGLGRAGAAPTRLLSPHSQDLALALQLLLPPFPHPHGLSLGSAARAGLGKEDEWSDLLADVPRDVQSRRPWLLPAPSVGMNSPLGNGEILSTRAGEEPMEISWSNPLVLQIIIIMIALDGSNSQRAFTSGSPLCTPGPLGWQSSCGSFYSPPQFVAEETQARRGKEMDPGHTPGFGMGSKHSSLLPELSHHPGPLGPSAHEVWLRTLSCIRGGSGGWSSEVSMGTRQVTR